MPQGRQIFPGLSVRDNLHFARWPKGCAKRATIAEALTDFPELVRLLDRPGGALSGGEQQLLALARALCGRPELLLLDEPTEGIQPSIVQAMVERIGALRRRGLAVLLVEQNLDFIRALADRALLIQRGRIGANDRARRSPTRRSIRSSSAPETGVAPVTDCFDRCMHAASFW